MVGWRSIVGIVLLGFLLKRTWHICTLLQPWKVVYNHAPGPCHLVPPVANGSEDMQFLPNGKVIMSSGIKIPGLANNPRVMNAPGQFYVFDFNAPEEGAKVVSCSNFPRYGTKNFAPHGISVLEQKGEVLLFVVNHYPEGPFEKDTIEKFRYDMTENTAEHLKTYSGDYLQQINDVVAVGPESFYITNWIYSRNYILSRLEVFVAQLQWSSLLYYDEGKTRTVADGFIMANGVSISPDKKHIYVVTLGDLDIKVYKRNSDGSLTFAQSKVFRTTTCDNLHVDGDTGDVWTGCHPIALRTMKYMEEEDEHRPKSPSQVLRIKSKEGLLTDDVTEVYANDGSAFNASTIAVFHRETSAMLVGSIEQNLLYCQIKTLQ